MVRCALLVFALLVAGCSGGDAGDAADDAAPTDPSGTVTGDATSAPSSSPATIPDVAIDFTVTPTAAEPGDVVELRGTACPPVAWPAVEEWGAFVVVGTDALHVRTTFGVVEPSSGPGHLSFNLIPEYLDPIATTDPAPDGTWSAEWTVPSDADADITLTALCLVGPGLESGHVYYEPLTLALTTPSTPTSG